MRRVGRGVKKTGSVLLIRPQVFFGTRLEWYCNGDFLSGGNAYGRLRSEINISQNAFFSDLAANQSPGFPNVHIS
jgi:hypothetical protein